jgi:hypothetical protein
MACGITVAPMMPTDFGPQGARPRGLGDCKGVDCVKSNLGGGRQPLIFVQASNDPDEFKGDETRRNRSNATFRPSVGRPLGFHPGG